MAWFIPKLINRWKVLKNEREKKYEENKPHSRNPRVEI